MWRIGRRGIRVYESNRLHRAWIRAASSQVEEPVPPEVKTDMRRLLEVAKPEWRLIGGSFAALVVNSGANLAFPYGMGKIIDAMVHPTAASLPLSAVMLGLSGVFVVGAASTIARVSWMTTATARITAQLRSTLFASYLTRDTSFFDRHRTGDLLSRLVDDVHVVAKASSENLAQGTKRLLEGAGGLAILLYLTPSLTSVLSLMVPPIALGGWMYGRYVKALSRGMQDAVGQAAQFAEERLASVRTVRLFTQERREMAEFDARATSVLDATRKVGRASGAFYAGLSLCTNFALLGVMSYGGSLVTAGTMTVGELTSFLLYSVYVGVALSGGASLYSDLMKGLGAGGRVFEVLDSLRDRETNQIKRLPTAASVGAAFEHGAPSITFRDVAFTYPTRNTPVLQNLNLEIRPGECVALVGHSGSGKSTVASLLARLYEVDGGAVLVDGVQVQQLDPAVLRRHIGFVPQEPTLFHGTVRENIAYGVPERAVTDEEIVEAARMASADEFVSRFPDGYQTVLGERGTTLSGGQKQRIAIARAFLRNPSIFMLDEATSALDAASEKLVHQALERIKRNRTTLIIAHRLSTIRMADRIVVLGDGKVLQDGSHLELMQLGGVYADLVKTQIN